MTRTRRGAGGKRRANSQRWLARQQRDPFTQRARQEGRVSRAHFKLRELDERLGLLRPGMTVLELGAAPGGWTGYIESRLAGGMLIACDARPVQAGADTVVVTGLMGNPTVELAIDEALAGGRVDLVLSDMAPNITGVRVADQAWAMELAQLAVQASERWLKPGGTMVVKIFQGEDVEAWMRHNSKLFANIRWMKPRASRRESREVYVVGRQFLVSR